MNKGLILVAVLAVVSVFCMAPVECSLSGSSSGGSSYYVPHPGPTYITAMSPYNLGTYDHSSVTDSLITYDDALGYTFTTGGDVTLVISCVPLDLDLDPCMDLYAVDGSYTDWLMKDCEDGFFTIGTSYYPDALLVMNSLGGPGEFDVIVSSYHGNSYGDFDLAVCAIPYAQNNYLGTNAADGLALQDEVVTGSLTSNADVHYYYVSVDDPNGERCEIYVDTLSFDALLVMLDIDGTVLETGIDVTYGYQSLDFYSSSYLAPGTYILEVSSDDTGYGSYDIGIDLR